jgi:hypothetical protein
MADPQIKTIREIYDRVINKDHPAKFLAEKFAAGEPVKLAASEVGYAIMPHKYFIPAAHFVPEDQLQKLLAEYYEVDGGDCSQEIYRCKLGRGYSWTPHGVEQFLFNLYIVNQSKNSGNPGVIVETLFCWK